MEVKIREVIDVICYPIKYIEYDRLTAIQKNILQPKVTVQIELSKEKKEKVLEMIFEGKDLGVFMN